MPLVSIPAVFDGTTVTLLETAPYHEPYQVVVTFVAPVIAETDASTDMARFWSSFGAWADESAEVAPIESIRADRRSKREPPQL